MKSIKVFCIVCAVVLSLSKAAAQIVYPYPSHYIKINAGEGVVRMAYMDKYPNVFKQTVLLLHGKNFNGYYWKNVIPALMNAGYRVIVPDQVGWGRSEKPVTDYSFSFLASNTKALLDSLKVDSVIVIGHSMGGMLAARFAMMYPEKVTKLILENPIGLEDYKRFVPYQPLSILINKERSATYESYKKYQQTYYPAWKPEYEQYVAAQAESFRDLDFKTTAVVNAMTYQMIYNEPVVYEWDRINQPTLLIIGQEDRTVVGKDQLTEEQKKMYGHYPALGKKTQASIKNAKLVELKGVGHIPHIQDLDSFLKEVLKFIN